MHNENIYEFEWKRKRFLVPSLTLDECSSHSRIHDAQQSNAICIMCTVSSIAHSVSFYSDRRHDNIAYLINLSSIHVSTVVYANFFKHLNSWENWMQMVSMEATQQKTITNICCCFAVQSVIAFRMFLRLHGIYVVWLACEWRPFHERRRKNENQNISWKKMCEKNIELIWCYRCCDEKWNIFEINIVHFSTGFSFSTRPTIDCDRSHCVTYANRNFLLSFRWHAVNGEQQRRQKGFSIVKPYSILIGFYKAYSLFFCLLFPVMAASIPFFNIQTEYNEQWTNFFWLSFLKFHSAFV